MPQHHERYEQSDIMIFFIVFRGVTKCSGRRG